jgi:hypothetical protein
LVQWYELEELAMDQWKLGEAEQRRLSETLHRARDAREYQRTLAVLECGRGKCKSAVARSLNVTRQSVHNWVSRYRCSKQPTALCDAPRSGRPRKADEVVEALVQACQEDSVTAFFLVSAEGSDPPIMDVLGIKASEATQIVDPHLGVQRVDEDMSNLRRLVEQHRKKCTFPRRPRRSQTPQSQIIEQMALFE